MNPTNQLVETASSIHSKEAVSVWTIYCHTHVSTGRHYIGLTKRTMLQRWNQHVLDAKKAKSKRSHFANAIRAYGKDAFSHRVLEKFSSIEEANEAEKKWVTHFNTADPMFGFNLIPGGAHTPHPITNPWDRPDYREKMSAISKERWQDPEFQIRHAESLKDVYSDPDYRSKLSNTMKVVAATPEGLEQRRKASPTGRTLSDEHRAHISASSRCQEPEVRARIMETTRAAMKDPELQERMKKNHAEAMARPEVRAKISAGNRNTGKKLSEETKSRIGASLRLRPKATHCKRGHSLEFVRPFRNGKRACPACAEIRSSS